MARANEASMIESAGRGHCTESTSCSAGRGHTTRPGPEHDLEARPEISKTVDVTYSPSIRQIASAVSSSIRNFHCSRSSSYSRRPLIAQ